MYKCGKCNVEMEEEFDIQMKYQDIDLPEAEGLRCSVCGIEFLEESVVVDELNGSETMLESK
ncbi:DUF7479 domain-containing protein [Anaeromicrobium sediminis]|uniref:DUF7479 domain-containing protein n=1 Tax=Anaeromicrobium sediminis TaxID=1478221 RepID=A0A267MLS8_9FIRM|nr:hypothetical protein [Anaeromicrobium sediminis]PAB60564.1 hypothetical protein CCE28_03195 [Anaeromicrobium sediminis]